MKKLFTVLAVLLVASLAFAGFSGNIKAQYNFNFDEKTIAYGESEFDAVDVSFKWDSQTYTVGEADGTHVELALTAGFDGFYNLSADHAAGYDPFKKDDAWNWALVWEDGYHRGTAVAAGVTLSVDTFKIVAKDWEVSFIDAVGLNFAKSAIDTKKFNGDTLEENVQNYSLSNNLKDEQNIAVTAFGYKFGFGLGTVNNWSKDFTFALTAVTPDYDFNGVKAQFGAGYQVAANDWKIAASAKASYAADKWSLSGAYDMLAVKDFVKNELAVNFGFAPVTVDVYFANEGSKATDKYEKYFWTDTATAPSYVTDPHTDKTSDTLDSNYLSAKVVVDVAKVAENVPVTVTLTGKNLINEDKQIVSVSATTTIVPNFKFGAYFNDWFDNETKIAASNGNRQKLGATVEFTGVEKLTLNGEVAYKFAKGSDDAKRLYVNAGAAYAADLFTADATIAMEKPYEEDAIFGAVVGAKSTTLVAGAELSAKARFNFNNLSKLDTTATNDLTLACKVSF